MSFTHDTVPEKLHATLDWTMETESAPIQYRYNRQTQLYILRGCSGNPNTIGRNCPAVLENQKGLGYGLRDDQLKNIPIRDLTMFIETRYEKRIPFYMLRSQEIEL